MAQTIQTEKEKSSRPVPGDLPRIAEITDYSLSHVQAVSRGLRENEEIGWAISRIRELRESIWLQLKAEYQERFNKKCQ